MLYILRLNINNTEVLTTELVQPSWTNTDVLTTELVKTAGNSRGSDYKANKTKQGLTPRF